MKNVWKIIDTIAELMLYASVGLVDYSIFKDAYFLGHLGAAMSIMLTPIIAGATLWERIRK